MRVLIALLATLSIVLSVMVWQLESQPPQVIYVPPDEELPFVIGIYYCDVPFAMVWTSEPPQWFAPDDQLDAEQLRLFERIVAAGQSQNLNVRMNCPGEERAAQ